MKARVTLTAVRGPLLGKHFVFAERNVFLLGRGEECEARLPEDDNFVSRIQFFLDVNPPRVTIKDAGSHNGTLLNGQWIGGRRIPSGAEPGAIGREHEVRDGDAIIVGVSEFRVGIVAPLTCVHCGAEGSLTQGLCVDCLPKVTTRPLRPPDLTVPRCATCKEEVSDEVTDLVPTNYVCEACRGDPEAVRLRRSVVRLRTRGESYPPTIRGYRRIKRLGIGGSGAAYLAERLSDRAKIVLKLMLPDRAVDAHARQLFEREHASMWLLRHPNLIEQYDRGETEGVLWFAMEHCELGNLESLAAARGGTLAPREAVNIMLQTLDGLGAMHARGFVHRDMKPENVLLAQRGGRGVAKVADLGLAHCFERAGLSGVTVTGMAAGSVHFMPPEQLSRYRFLKPESDVWASAALLYYLLTGELTRDFSAAQDILLTVVFGRIVPVLERAPKLHVPLAEAIDRALIADATQRTPTAAQFRRELEIAMVSYTKP